MENNEVLEKVQKKKVYVGEMEKTKINKACWVANIVACAVAVALMVTLGALRNFAGLYSIGFINLAWSSVFYFCQYFIAKRPWPVLIGAVLSVIGACIMLTMFILYSVGVI